MYDADNTYSTNRVSLAELADFNGDSHLDLVALVTGISSSHATTLFVFIGIGDGNFNDVPVVTSLGIANDVRQMEFVDINLDGHADILLGHIYRGRQYNLSLSLGNGTGSFLTARELLPNHRRVKQFDIGDLVMNGYPDLVAITGWNPGKVVVLQNNGVSNTMFLCPSATLFQFASSLKPTKQSLRRELVGRPKWCAARHVLHMPWKRYFSSLAHQNPYNSLSAGCC